MWGIFVSSLLVNYSTSAEWVIIKVVLPISEALTRN